MLPSSRYHIFHWDSTVFNISVFNISVFNISVFKIRESL
ncbi:hypothetical protein SOHN41_02155 [Shewanella sp. HN-41]|nr:hypothetical protein SOHN41_02155 [Shewanella sp. HN-41]